VGILDESLERGEQEGAGQRGIGPRLGSIGEKRSWKKKEQPKFKVPKNKEKRKTKTSQEARSCEGLGGEGGKPEVEA